MARKKAKKSDKSAPERTTRPGWQLSDVRRSADDDRGFPVVGVGASAGGLEAFIALFRALPADTGMAFVLVPHLAPTHASALGEILSRTTSMPVQEVADDPAVEPNRVYVIPPGRDMVIAQERCTSDRAGPMPSTGPSTPFYDRSPRTRNTTRSA